MTNERAIELLNRISDSQFDGIHGDERREALEMAVRALEGDGDTISRQEAIDAVAKWFYDVFGITESDGTATIFKRLRELPSAQPEIIRCKDCKHWRQQTNYQGSPLSFGFCESDDMWRSLYGETYEVAHIDTDDDFYCGYAERRTDE